MVIYPKEIKMGIQYNVFTLVAMAATASALKCIQGTYDIKSSKECTSGLDRCMNATTGGVSTSTTYACFDEDQAKAAGFSDKTCSTTNSVETCLCLKDDCNAPASVLKCYQGSGDSAVLSSCTGSPSPDRCTKQTNGSVVTYACGLASNIIIEGSVADNACSTIKSVEICLCSTDGCNTVPATTPENGSVTMRGQFTLMPIYTYVVAAIMKMSTNPQQFGF